MLNKKRLYILLCGVTVFAMLLASCGTPSTPTAEQPSEEEPTAVEEAEEEPTEAEEAEPTEVEEAEEAEEEPLKVGLFLPDKKVARYETKDKPFFEQRLEEICPDCELIAHIADSDPVEQKNAVEQAITNGADVLVIMAVDTKAAAVMADDAKKNGIPVLAYSRLLENSDGVTAYIGWRLADIGEAQAESLLKGLEEKGVEKPWDIAMINGSPTDSNMPPIRDGAMEVFQPLIDAGELNIVRSVDVQDWDPAKAQAAMEQILTASGGEIDGVYCMNDGMAGGAHAAMNAAGIEPVPPITGLDASLAAVQRILVGEQYSTVYMPIEGMASLAAELAYELATTGEVPEDVADETIDNGAKEVPSIANPVISVEKEDIGDVLIEGGFWTVEDICTEDYEEACKEAGLLE